MPAETKHTPGPWEIREVAHEATPYRKRRVYRLEIIAPQYLHGRRTHSRDICQMVDYCEWTDHPANARLIAKAPEMFDTMKAFVTAWERCLQLEKTDVAVRMARALIAEIEAPFSPKGSK